MRILIATDIEGVAGVVHPEQTRAGNAEYERARRLMTAEASAAVAGAIDGGATEVRVNDSHGDYRNLLPDALDPRAQLVEGKPRELGMMAGVEDCDAVFLVGWHARAQAAGVLSHTINSFAFARVVVDGAEFGEADLYGCVAGELGVPVALLTGDDAFVAEAGLRYPEAVRVAVKRAIGHRVAIAMSPADACAAIETGAREAMTRVPRLAPHAPRGPHVAGVVATSPALADLFVQLPLLRRRDAVSVEFDAPDMRYAVRVLNALSAMSALLR
jgi:D-amino peptidase